MFWILCALCAVLVLAFLFAGATKAQSDDPSGHADVAGGECGLVVLMLLGFGAWVCWKLFLDTR